MCEVMRVKIDTIFPMIKELLYSNKSIRITVTGMSMYPFLREGIDSVEFSNKSYSDIHIGDIVLIRRKSGEYILHRLLRKSQNYFFIIGDAQQWIEGPLSPDQIVGVVNTVWRKDKKILCSNSLLWKTLTLLWLGIIPFRYFILKTYCSLPRRKKCDEKAEPRHE